MAEIKTKNTKVKTELEKAGEQLDKFEQNVKDLTLDRMNQAPKEEVEAQTKLSAKEIEKSKDIYLKPERMVNDRQTFNEEFREEWNFKKQYVQFIAEHKEIIGEEIEIWTHPFGGVGAEFWKVPTNKPVWGPRYLAEQIRGCTYHRLRMEESMMRSQGQNGTFYGQMVVDNTVSRLTAEPVSSKKSVFMGAANF